MNGFAHILLLSKDFLIKKRGWGVVDHESDQSYHGLITLSQRRDHEKRSDYASVRKCDFRSLRDHGILLLGVPDFVNS